MSLRNLSEQHLSTPNQSHLADMYTVNASEGEEEEHCQHNDKRRRLSGLFRSGPGRLLLIALSFALLGPQYLSFISVKRTTNAPPRDISISTSKVTSGDGGAPAPKGCS